MSITQWPKGARDYVKSWEKKTNLGIAWHRESLTMGSLFSLGGSLFLREVICSTAFIGGLPVPEILCRGINRLGP